MGLVASRAWKTTPMPVFRQLPESAIPGNSASGGRRIYNAGAMTVYGCTLSGNSAEFGGGLFNGGTVTLITATLAGNTATGTSTGLGQGGALWNNGAMTLSATTVSANFGYQGGGIWNGDAVSADSADQHSNILNSNSLTLVNSIVAGNTLTDPRRPGRQRQRCRHQRLQPHRRRHRPVRHQQRRQRQPGRFQQRPSIPCWPRWATTVGRPRPCPCCLAVRPSMPAGPHHPDGRHCRPGHRPPGGRRRRL